jgi:hypothetical protein
MILLLVKSDCCWQTCPAGLLEVAVLLLLLLLPLLPLMGPLPPLLLLLLLPPNMPALQAGWLDVVRTIHVSSQPVQIST